MVEYSEDEARRSEQIAETLLAGETPRFDMERGLSIIDVEERAAEFRDDLEILSLVRADVPSIRIGENGSVPVSLSLFGLDWFRFGRGFFDGRPWRRPAGLSREMMLEYFYSALRDGYEPFEGLERISADEARANFLSRATDFLATRISALRAFRGGEDRTPPGISTLHILQRSGGPRISAPGCLFSVSANSPGLRVFWSGAYYVSPNYFGHPTTPTAGVLQSGTYIFGVDGGAYGNSIQWDFTATCALPGKPSVHLNF
ncbi:MAG: hypothetical protein ACLP4V_00790 [Methylocella sp.]